MTSFNLRACTLLFPRTIVAFWKGGMVERKSNMPDHKLKSRNEIFTSENFAIFRFYDKDGMFLMYR